MASNGNRSYGVAYLLDHSYPSYVTGIIRVRINGDYTYHSIHLETSLTPSFDEILEPPISIVFEQVTIDIVMSWSFTKMGADMIRIHFSKVYPPPGDQFLVKDSAGNVVFEYKWNFGAEAMSPWVPGNVLTVEVVPTWSSIYGGVNHYYFEVDVMGVYDPEAPTTTTSTTITTTTTSTTTTSTTTTTTTSSMAFPPILIGFVTIGVVAIVAIILKKR